MTTEMIVTDLAQPPAVSERILLSELNHRINNEFATAINRISIEAVRADHPAVKTALCNVVELLHQSAEVHRALKMPERDDVIDAAEYLQTLCRSISRSKLERAGIKLVLATDKVWLHSGRCWQLGMIVYELVTNAARHAFFDGREGEIRVELLRSDTFARCKVSDNGSATKGVKPGGGLTIIGDLAKSLGGNVDRSLAATGTLFKVTVPFLGKELRANRSRRTVNRVVRRVEEGLDRAQL
jgi:two-component sensor histidine kinase